MAEGTVSVRAKLGGLWLFTRPHAFIGTCIEALALYILALSAANSAEFSGFVVCFLAIIAMHIYGMGVNQLADMEVDRINKPFLPLISGSISITEGKWITFATGVIALIIGSIYSLHLLGTLTLLMFMLTTYSLPPTHFKNHWLSAALVIALSRSLIFGAGYFFVFTDGLSPKEWPPLAVGLLGFIFVFTGIIALTKDVPDLKGDRKFAIQSLASLLGEEKTLKLGFGVLLSLFIATGLLGCLGVFGNSWLIFAIGHTLQIALLTHYFRRVNHSRHKELVSYYMSLWNLFYIEFGIFVLASFVA